MTPQSDASELESGLRTRFLRLVSAGDEAFARDDDALAIESWTRALELVAGAASPQLRDSVVARVVVAHARGGGAEMAVQLLDELPEPVRVSEAMRFARARAFDRLEAEPGFKALAAWFDAWAAAATAQDVVGSSYARLRAENLWSQRVRSRSDLESVLELIEGPGARTCAARFGGVDPRTDDDPKFEAPGWTLRCLPGAARRAGRTRKVGLLLPRTGRLAALADGQLAAATTAARLASADQADLVIEFRDAGSDAESAVAGAEALLELGVTVIVGPVGAKQTRAVAQRAAGQARVITPGPPVGLAEGVAPTLEDRVTALARRGLHKGCRGSWTVLHAEGAYGRRGSRHFKDLLATKEFSSLASSGQPTVLTYPASETSFAGLVRGKGAAFDRGHCVIVIDTLARTSGIARQLRRDGKQIGADGLAYYSTAEGLDARALAGEKNLAGTVVAPLALPASRSAFQDSFHLAAGKPADDQALLLWSALSLAMWEERGAAPTKAARTARFDEEGSLDVSTQE